MSNNKLLENRIATATMWLAEKLGERVISSDLFSSLETNLPARVEGTVSTELRNIATEHALGVSERMEMIYRQYLLLIDLLFTEGHAELAVALLFDPEYRKIIIWKLHQQDPLQIPGGEQILGALDGRIQENSVTQYLWAEYQKRAANPEYIDLLVRTALQSRHSVAAFSMLEKFGLNDFSPVSFEGGQAFDSVSAETNVAYGYYIALGDKPLSEWQLNYDHLPPVLQKVVTEVTSAGINTMWSLQRALSAFIFLNIQQQNETANSELIGKLLGTEPTPEMVDAYIFLPQLSELHSYRLMVSLLSHVRPELLAQSSKLRTDYLMYFATTDLSFGGGDFMQIFNTPIHNELRLQVQAESIEKDSLVDSILNGRGGIRFPQAYLPLLTGDDIARLRSRRRSRLPENLAEFLNKVDEVVHLARAVAKSPGARDAETAIDTSKKD
jgi:hypothetical protein